VPLGGRVKTAREKANGFGVDVHGQFSTRK
jgi:hypothetical protein